MSFFGKVGSFFKAIGKGVAHGFVAIFGEDAAKKFASGAEELLKTALGTIAIDAVNLVQNSNPISGDADKRSAAFSLIKTDATKQGIAVTDSIVNMLIELAVNALKGKITAAPAA